LQINTKNRNGKSRQSSASLVMLYCHDHFILHQSFK